MSQNVVRLRLYIRKGIGGDIMKKRKCLKEFFKKNWDMLVMIAFMIITMGISFFADYKLELFECDMIPLVTVLFSATTAIAGIWVTCYFLFIQLFRDRYPLEIIKETQSKGITYAFIMVVYTIILGSVVIFIGKGVASNIWFCLVAISTALHILALAYKSNKSLMMNTHITKYCNRIKTELSKSKNSIARSSIKRISNILEECIVKEEYYTATTIIQETGDIFREFLKNAVSINMATNPQQVNQSFENLIKLNIFELKCCKQIKSEMLINKILNQQYKNLIFCYNISSLDRYKDYLDAFNLFVYKIQKENEDNIVLKAYEVYFKTLNAILDNKDNPSKNDYVTYTFNQISKFVSSLFFVKEDANTIGYMQFLTEMYVHAIEENDENLYTVVMEKFKLFSNEVLSSQKTFNSLKVYYAIIFNKALERNFGKAMSLFCDIIDGDHICNEPIFLEYKQYCIGELQKHNDITEDNYKTLFERHINILEEFIKLKSEYHGTVRLPNFSKKILEAKSTNDIVDYIKNIRHLFNLCIIRDNVSAFFAFLDFTKYILIRTKQEQRDIQKELLNIYFWLIGRCRDLVNKQFIEIVFGSLDDAIRTLDREKAVSSGLCDYIINELYDCIQLDTTSGFKSAIMIIELFFDFFKEEDEVGFICLSSDKKKAVYRALYNIGTDCIENSFEEGLRRVSHVIGWLTIYSIKQKTSELTNYLIDRALDIYNISKKMMVSPQTQTFILTLFTTVGMYCCKSPQTYTFRKRIVTGIGDEDVEKIKVAISLRTSETDGWNRLFDDRTQELKHQFLECFKK